MSTVGTKKVNSFVAVPTSSPYFIPTAQSYANTEGLLRVFTCGGRLARHTRTPFPGGNYSELELDWA